MAFEAIDQTKTASSEDLRVQLAPVVHDDDHRGVRLQRLSAPAQHVRHALDIRAKGSSARPASRRAELAFPSVIETEERVRVAVLLVVVDETWIRR